MSKFKVGDKVTIIGNQFDHNFDMGEEVEITNIEHEDDITSMRGLQDFKCTSDSGTWWVTPKDIELTTNESKV